MRSHDAARNPIRRPRRRWPNPFGVICLAFGLSAGLWTVASRAAQNETGSNEASSAASGYSWTPALLYGILSSSNSGAGDYLYDAAFAAGPPIVPDLIAALQDDRTAEFAAQSLAFIGGKPALASLEKLPRDPRDLDLSRFYYGALGEFDTPQANAALLNVVRSANSQPDRTVTEAAIIALTARSDLSLVAPLQQAESKLTDPVIQDDLQNAISIIRRRSRYLASKKGSLVSESVPGAVRAYFRSGATPVTQGSRSGSKAPPATFTVRIDRVVISSGKTRALAHVRFEEEGTTANYRIVLQQQDGRWNVASVWLGSEMEKPGSPPANGPRRSGTHP